MNKTNVTQIANFEKLLGFCNAQGAAYNPPKDSMKVPSLISLFALATQSAQTVNDYTAAYSRAVGERSRAFEQLPKFMTRLLNALKAADASVTTIQEISRYKKRFHMQITSRPVAGTTADSANGDPPMTKHSRSQMAFDQQVNNFEIIVKRVGMETMYVTNDTTLTTEALGTYLEDLRAKNKAVRDIFATLSAARKRRDKILFAKEGIYPAAQAVKCYFKSILGTQNASAREVSKMKFFTKKASLIN